MNADTLADSVASNRSRPPLALSGGKKIARSKTPEAQRDGYRIKRASMTTAEKVARARKRADYNKKNPQQLAYTRAYGKARTRGASAEECRAAGREALERCLEGKEC